jgi:hypothetical protein
MNIEIDGFEFRIEKKMLHVSDSNYDGHAAVIDYADRFGVTDPDLWERFWVKWCAIYERKKTKAIQKFWDKYCESKMGLPPPDGGWLAHDFK